MIRNRRDDRRLPVEETKMKQDPTPSQYPPDGEKPSEVLSTPLSDAQMRQLDLETERNARRQAEVGQAVRGGGLASRG